VCVCVILTVGVISEYSSGAMLNFECFVCCVSVRLWYEDKCVCVSCQTWLNEVCNGHI
jgi:hypothetical protein